MKQIIKNVSKFLLLIVMVLSVNLISNSFTADAGNSYTLNLNDTFVKGTISKGVTHYYNVTVPSDGWLTITYQGWSIDDSYYEITNYDQTKSYYKKNVYHSSNTNPLTDSKKLALSKGKYIVKVYGYSSDNYGDYRIKGSFIAAGNNETESNNYFDKAMSLAQNQQVTGFISEDDKLDFYKITVPSETTIRLTYTARIADSNVVIWNSDYVSVFSKNVYTASEDSPLTAIIDYYCTAGTYYIKINGYSDDVTGRYQLKWSIPSQENTDIVIGGDDDSSSVSVSKVTSVKAKAKSNKNVKVTWKKQSNASKYEIQISTNKKFKKNLVTKKVASSKKAVTIKSKKKGTAYVRVRAISTSGSKGSWSKTVKVKVK